MYDNVTQQFSLPVLIPATAEQQEGVATFEQELGAPAPVRRFKDSDLKDAAKHMTEAEALHFHAVIALTHALQNPSDTIALRKMLPLMRHIGFVGLSRALSRD